MSVADENRAMLVFAHLDFHHNTLYIEPVSRFFVFSINILEKNYERRN